MIARDGWKLIYYPTLGVNRLYRTSVDPFEMSDLSDNPEYRAKIAELHAELLELGTALADPIKSKISVNSRSRKQGAEKEKY